MIKIQTADKNVYLYTLIINTKITLCAFIGTQRTSGVQEEGRAYFLWWVGVDGGKDGKCGRVGGGGDGGSRGWGGVTDLSRCDSPESFHGEKKVSLAL